MSEKATWIGGGGGGQGSQLRPGGSEPADQGGVGNTFYFILPA